MAVSGANFSPLRLAVSLAKVSPFFLTWHLSLCRQSRRSRVAMSPSLGSGEFGGRIQGGKCGDPQVCVRGRRTHFPKPLPKDAEPPAARAQRGRGRGQGAVCASGPSPVCSASCSLSRTRFTSRRRALSVVRSSVSGPVRVLWSN